MTQTSIPISLNVAINFQISGNALGFSSNVSPSWKEGSLENEHLLHPNADEMRNNSYRCLFAQSTLKLCWIWKETKRVCRGALKLLTKKSLKTALKLSLQWLDVLSSNKKSRFRERLLVDYKVFKAECFSTKENIRTINSNNQESAALETWELDSEKVLFCFTRSNKSFENKTLDKVFKVFFVAQLEGNFAKWRFNKSFARDFLTFRGNLLSI